MSREQYRYAFTPEAPIAQVEATLLLAIVAVEGLHGESQTRLDAAHLLDRGRAVCVVDAGTAVGRDINRLFTNFLRREFGEESFTVERVADDQARTEVSA